MEIRSPINIRKYLRSLADTAHIQPGYRELSQSQKGTIVAEFNKACQDCVKDPDKETVAFHRYLIWGWLFMDDNSPLSPVKSEWLQGGMWWALRDWIKPQKIEDEWTIRAGFKDETRWCLSRALYDYNRSQEKGGIKMAELLRQPDLDVQLDIEPGGQVEFAVMNLGGIVTKNDIPKPSKPFQEPGITSMEDITRNFESSILQSETIDTSDPLADIF